MLNYQRVVCGYCGYYVRIIDIQWWFIDCLTIWTIWLFDYSTSSIILPGLSAWGKTDIKSRGDPETHFATGSLRLQNQKKHSPLQLACSKKLPIPKLRFCWVTHNPIQLSHQRPETLPFPETRWALFAPPVAREGRLCVPLETSGMNVSMKNMK